MSKEDVKSAIQGLPKEELRAELRAAFKEIINEQYASLGKLVSVAFLTAILGAAMYFLAISQGWKKG